MFILDIGKFKSKPVHDCVTEFVEILFPIQCSLCCSSNYKQD